MDTRGKISKFWFRVETRQFSLKTIWKNHGLGRD